VTVRGGGEFCGLMIRSQVFVSPEPRTQDCFSVLGFFFSLGEIGNLKGAGAGHFPFSSSIRLWWNNSFEGRPCFYFFWYWGLNSGPTPWAAPPAPPPLFGMGFFRDRLPRLASNHDPPDLCLLSSEDYRHKPQVLTRSSLVSSRSADRAPVAHTCNPSYSGGRDQEDHGLRPVPGK
jgi:hypothetical protein